MNSQNLAGSLRVSALALFFAIASLLGPNRYIYGIFDTAYTVVFDKVAARPELYTRDLVAPEAFASFVVDFTGWLWNRGVSIEVIYFSLTLLSHFLAFLAMQLLGRRMSGSTLAGIVAMYFLLFSPEALGSVPVLDRLFKTRLLAIPFALFAFLASSCGRFAIAFLLCGLLTAVHVLTAVHLAVILTSTAAWSAWRGEKVRPLLCAAGLLAGTAPFLVRFVVFGGSTGGTFGSDSEWLAILAATSSHHLFPFSWPLFAFVDFFALLLLAWISLKAAASGPGDRVLPPVIAAVLTMCALGTVFAELVPIQSIFRWQFFRSTVLVIPLIQATYAGAITQVLRAPFAVRWKILAALASYPLFYSALGGTYGYLGFLAWASIASAEKRTDRTLVAALAVIVAVLAAHAYSARGPFFISSLDYPKWRETQAWVRENTTVDALVFVPPTSEGFRVESERSVYVEHRDATLGIFDRAFALEWKRRIECLGSSIDRPSDAAYHAMTLDDFRTRAALDGLWGENYVVRSARAEPFAEAPAFNNGTFTITRLSMFDAAKSSVARSVTGR